MASIAAFFGSCLPSSSSATRADDPGEVHLELAPRVCSLSVSDTQCEAEVHASWRAPKDQSLCLVIVGHPEIKRCWERYTAGTYTIALVFSSDLTVQLKDLDLQQVLASQVVRVIREAIQFRRKRRDPWNIFD